MSGNDVVPSEGGVLAEFGSGLKSIPGAVKAIARLVGGAADVGNSWLDVLKALGEQKASAIRNDTASALAISKAITKEAVKYVAADEALAERAAITFMSDAIRKQENRESVAKAAVEDLDADPPPVDTPGPSDDWLNRFQRYAEDVTTEEVQIMWGRVLAAEIRRPGAVSPRALRMIDEIDKESADIFSQFERFVCPGSILKCLSGIIEFNNLVKLIEAGLVVDPGIAGHIRRFSKTKNNFGDDIWYISFGDWAVAFRANSDLSMLNNNVTLFDDISIKSNPIRIDDGTPLVDVYLLTSVGSSIANIIFKNTNDVIRMYSVKLAEKIAPNPVYIYGRAAGENFRILETIQS